MKINDTEWVPVQYFDGGSVKAWPTRKLAEDDAKRMTNIEWEIRELVEIRPGTADDLARNFLHTTDPELLPNRNADVSTETT